EPSFCFPPANSSIKESFSYCRRQEIKEHTDSSKGNHVVIKKRRIGIVRPGVSFVRKDFKDDISKDGHETKVSPLPKTQDKNPCDWKNQPKLEDLFKSISRLKIRKD